MKKTDVLLIACGVVLVFLWICYLFFDFVFSFGILEPLNDPRKVIIVIVVSLMILLFGAFFFKWIVKRKNN